MKMIAGLLEPTVGEILFDGRPLREDVIGYKRRMGYVPEEPFLYNHLWAQLRGLSPRQSAERPGTPRNNRERDPSWAELIPG
jgi:ABC-type cobalamin/Fe3+-siderophores transport system ATPase subunit